MKLNNKKSSILVIGDAYAETQYFTSQIPGPNEFQIATDATSVYGSKTINAARILARLKNTVTFFAHVGQDINGENTASALTNWSISPLLKKVDKEKTGQITVITDQDGHSSITLFRGANQTVSVEDIEKLRSDITNNDAVYAATNLPLESLYTLVGICNELKKPLFLDIPNQQTTLDLKKLSSVTFFAPNRQETQLLLSSTISTIEEAKEAAVALRQKIAGTIIITLDKDGCIVLESNKSNPIHFSTKPLKSVDDTAAGDIFRAVFFDAFLQTDSITESIQRATSIASESTKIKGVDKTLSSIDLG